MLKSNAYEITRGETFSIRFRFRPEQLEVGNIKDIYLAVVQGVNKTITFLGEESGDWQINNLENSVTYHFTQEETLSLKAGLRVYLEAHVLDIFGERSKAFGGTYLVEDTEYPEVMT